LIVTIDRRLQIGSWPDLGMFVQNVMIAAGARGLQLPTGDVFEISLCIERTAPDTAEEMVVCGLSLGFAAESSTRNAPMPKLQVSEFATFVGFED
jgi:hypothetical protein